MKLSVIIPVYNGANHIIKCLESLKNQTFKDFRIIIIDDGSKDNSHEIIESYLSQNKGLDATLIKQKNMGVAYTRNKGIEIAETEYITFVDQDDYVESDYLMNYIQAIECSGADIVCGGYQRVHAETGEKLRTVSLSNNPWAKFIVVAPWAHLYRTKYIKSNPVRFLDTGIGEDVYFTLMAYSYTNKIITISDTGYFWADNPESQSNAKQKRIQKSIDPFILLNALSDNLPNPTMIDHEYLEYYFYRYIIWYLLFTVRQTPSSLISPQYQKLIVWLKCHYNEFDHNRLISIFRPAGEPFSIRFCVWGFNILYRCHMILPFLKLISQKE